MRTRQTTDSQDNLFFALCRTPRKGHRGFH
ncbi:hypothetical protein [Serratia symbiotica]